MKKKIIAGFLATSLVFGASGVYAGKLINSYKTPRGNTATVEQENIHKNRIGLTVNGKVVKGSSWYHDTEKTYVPLRAVSEMLGATVNYNDKTMSADILLDPDKYSKEDLDYLKLLTEFNYTLDRVDSVAGAFKIFSNGLSITKNEIDFYNSSATLDKRVNGLNDWIERYNNSIDEVTALMNKANKMGLLLESDFTAFDSALNNISKSIDYYKVAVDNLYTYYSYRTNSSFNSYLTNSGKGFDFALASQTIISEQKHEYYNEIFNFKGYKATSASKLSENSKTKATKKELYKTPLN